MFDQVVRASAFLAHICNDLLDHIVLVVTWEDEFFLSDSLGDTVLCHFFLFLYMGNETVKNVKQGVALQHFFPKVVGIITILVVRISGTASHTGSVRAHVEWHKVCGVVFELGRHPSFIEVNGEVDEETVIQPKSKLFGAAILLELLHGAPYVLPFELIFQLNGNDGNTVYREHHINGVRAPRRVLKLPCAAKNV